MTNYQDILGFIALFVSVACISYDFFAPMVTFMAAGGSAAEYYALLDRECEARFFVGLPTIIGLIVFYYISICVTGVGILIFPLPYYVILSII